MTLTRIVAAHDVGCAINPQNVEGQIQGGVTQAIGHTLMEEVKYASEGEPLTAGFLDYKIPSSLDLPAIEPLIVEVPDEEGPFGARGIGEPPILAMAPRSRTLSMMPSVCASRRCPSPPKRWAGVARNQQQGGRLRDMGARPTAPTPPPPTRRGRPRPGAGRPALDGPSAPAPAP